MKVGGRELDRLNDEQLAEVFRHAGNDPQVLEALNEALKQRDSDDALDLHIEVVKARRALRPAMEPTANAPNPARSGPVRDWLRAFLEARGLTRPDRRPLYRYRMADGEYEQAKTILRHLARSGRLARPDRRAGALFVAFGAEWFRRESASTFLRWDDLAPDLFPSVPYASKQQLTLFGLDYWCRSLRRSETAREFLLTLALEGGFPVRILADGARGWLKDYLRSIMRRAISWRVDSLAEIVTIADEERGRMRKSYQHDDFVALCSELVDSLLQLRRKAEAVAAGGIRNSAVLDARHPGWRDELPIYVPAEDDALVAELLTGLLDEQMSGLSTQGVEARRYLIKRDGDWIPAVQLLADGEIPPAKLPHLSIHARVRAIPTGELGHHLTGELALLEPPVGDQRRWRVRPFMRTTKLLTGFPFTAAITTTLSSPDAAPQTWIWPRGEALRSDVLVFQHDESATPQEPLLRFVRSGSVSSPAKTLYVLVPMDWILEPTTDGAVVEVENVPSLGRKLARLNAATYFRSPESESVRFKVEPDTEGRSHELELGSVASPSFVLADEQWELVETPVRPLVREAGKQPRPARPGELFVRRPGGKWVPATAALEGGGLMELSWRDPTVGIQLEKRLLALVPQGARLSGTMTDALSGEIQLEGLPGWIASACGVRCSIDSSGRSALPIRFTGRPVYRLPVTMRPPVGEAFDIIVPLVGRDAVLAMADGSILGPGTQVDVGALRGAVAVAPRRTVVQIAAKGSKAGGLKAVVDGELHLGVLRTGIDETLATMTDQDDLVELEFIGDTRRPIRISRYRQDQLIHELGMVRFSAHPNSPHAAPVARMILDPRHEHALEHEGNGLWRIPERCKGLCLVYLRDGVDIISRPVPVPRPGLPGGYAGELVSALMMQDYAERQRAVAMALSRVAQGEAPTGDLNWLLDAATNLNGLPPSAFDALKLLPSHPEALLRLLFNARDAGERGAIWSLQTELPFLWLALPLSAWKSALQVDYSAFANALQAVFGAEKAASEALARLAGLRDELVALEPALEAALAHCGLPTKDAAMRPALKDLTVGYVVGQHSRASDDRNDLASRLAASGLKIPREIETKSHTDFAGLFAPVLLGASACGKLVLESDMALLVRRSLREDPAYVSAAWTHLLEFYGSC